MARPTLSRGQRAAAACIGMIPVTVISFIIYFAGHQRAALAFEVLSVAAYTTWFYMGPKV